MSNVIKGWITSIIGVIVYVVTLLMIYNAKLNWYWEGIGAMAFGTILLLAPQTIEKWLNKIVNSKTRKNEINP
jgi:hypothetical protein